MNKDLEHYTMEFTKELLADPDELWSAIGPDAVEDGKARASVINKYISRYIDSTSTATDKLQYQILGQLIINQAIGYVRERAEEKARKYMSSDEYKESLKYPGI